MEWDIAFIPHFEQVAVPMRPSSLSSQGPSQSWSQGPPVEHSHLHLPREGPHMWRVTFFFSSVVTNPLKFVKIIFRIFTRKRAFEPTHNNSKPWG